MQHGRRTEVPQEGAFKATSKAESSQCETGLDAGGTAQCTPDRLGGDSSPQLEDQRRVSTTIRDNINAKKCQIQQLQKELATLRHANILSPKSPLVIDGPGHFYHCTGFTYNQFNRSCAFFDASPLNHARLWCPVMIPLTPAQSHGVTRCYSH